mgnify:CR=1 FL=1
MPIKYAEITIIINEEKETMKNYFNRILFGIENKINDNDTIIILFDDESVYDIKNDIFFLLNRYEKSVVSYH